MYLNFQLKMKELKERFLVDVGVGKKVEEYLCQQCYNVKAVRDIDATMDDDKIIKLAQNENRIIITMDKDFGELVYNQGLSHCGILLLRIKDADSKQKVKVITIIMENHQDKLKNNFCVYQGNKFRVKQKEVKSKE